METYIVRLSDRPLGVGFTLLTNDLFNGPHIIDPEEFDFFCGHSAVNFGSYHQFDGSYMIKVDVCHTQDPVVKLEMVVDMVFGANAALATFRWPEPNALIPKGCKVMTAADFAVGWGSRFMAGPEGMAMFSMDVADAVLTLRSAYSQAMSIYNPFNRTAPIGGEVEMDGQTILTHVCEMIEFMDGSTVYLTPEGVGYSEPEEALYVDDEDGTGQSAPVPDTSPMQSHVMISVMTH